MKKNQPYELTIVLPTYNERENIINLVPQISGVLRKNKISYEILVIDDNSPDGTAQIAKKMNGVRVISRERKMGIGSAYRCGFDNAKGRIIVTMDADLSHNPKYLPDLVRKINEGYDAAIGSRYVEGGDIVGWGVKRKLTSGIANGLTHFFLGIPVADVTSGYRAYKRELLKQIPLDSIESSGYSYLLETIFYAVRFGKIAETPIVFEDRKAGSSKLGKKEYFNYIKSVFRLFLKRVKQ